MNFGPYLPDLAPLNLDGLVTADGVYPTANGYRPVLGFIEAENGTLAARALGAYSARATDGSVFVFAGTTSDLYLYDNTGWASVASSFSATDLIGWRFVRYGSLVVATNGIDAIQHYDIESDSAFSALGGSPPTARYLAVVRDFLVAGFTDDNSLAMEWSGLGLPESWTPGTNEAGDQIMQAGGEITGITGGEYGLVFQERRISRMTYVGGDTIFQFDEISSNIGCIAPNSLVQVGNLAFFLAEQGFMVCDGTSVRPVGEEKVNRTWRSAADRGLFNYMSGVGDPKSAIVMWSLPDQSVPDTVYIYNYAIDRWSTAPVTAELLCNGMAQSIDLDSLDDIFGDLDSIPGSLDSPQFDGGNPAIYMFNSSHVFGGLLGSPVQATLRTGIMGGGNRIKGRMARVLTDAEGFTLNIYTRDTAGDAPTTNAFSTVGRGGWLSTRFNAGYVQQEVVIPAATDWTWITGTEEDFVSGGRW